MNPRPRILLWHWGRRGGGPRYTLELARALKARNEFDLHLSLSRQSEIFDAFAPLALPSFHVDTYDNLPSALLSSLKLPLIRQRFWRYVEQNQIDLIGCTMSHVWNVPILLGRSDRTPYLLVLHDAQPHPGDDVPFRQWLLKKEISYTSGIITLTEHVRQTLWAQYHYPQARSWVVPHGVFAYNAPARTPTPNAPLRLLFFGRILPYKGLGLLLEAYAMLRKEGCPVELIVAGNGDLHPYAGKLAELPGITIYNRWFGEADIGGLFAEADVAVLPYIEASQSGVVATAYAVGMPVIVTPVGGLTEQVKHEETGLVCAAATPAALADSIRRMANERALREKYARGAQTFAQTTLSWPAVAGQFSAAIHALLEAA